MVRTFCHESGHFIDRSLGKNGVDYSSNQDWTQAIKDNKMIAKKKSPTSYGENSPSEDFAESVVEFVADPIGFGNVFPNRAGLLKKIFK